MGAAEIAGLLVQGLVSLQQLAQLQATLQADGGRPATLDELKALRIADTAVRDKLQAAIDAMP